MSRLRLYLIGPPRIELEGEIVSLSHRKALALLAYLAVTRRSHTRQALAALLWPDYDPTAARGEVRRMVWVLNKSLGQGWLEVDRQTVMLPPRPDLWVDVERFRELATMAQQHHHAAGKVCSTCLASLTEAVALAQEYFLAGFTLADSPDFDAWQTFETESLRRELAGALEQLVQLLIQRGEAAGEQTITYARRWLALDPLHEPAHRRLMQLYAWSDQRAAALRQYHTLTRLLAEEVGLAPDEKTQALYRAIEENSLLPPAPHLKQEPPKERSEHTIPSPLLPGASAPPHNLPSQATTFIGREATLDDLQQRLSDPEMRLITLIGPGGVGKTRLALTLAERYLQPHTIFPDGVYFVALAPIGSAKVIIQTIAESLDVSLATAQEPAAQLLTYLRHKRMLLALDNFEHLLTGVGLVSQILQTAASVKMIVTSRERLNLVNETVWPLSGLNFARLETIETTLTYEAVRLFIQCARRVRPDFTLRVEDLSPLERILQNVWGMPLAIELAAAWLNVLSVAEVAAELSRGLDLLEGGLRDMPGRHHSMRLVFDHSWDRLETEEQALFTNLSVFKGSFTREAARQITGASLRLLAGLVNKSLLVSQPDTGRYELHALLRQYAQEKLEASPAAGLAIQQAHAAYYAALIQQCWVAWRGGQQRAAVAAVEQDIENIRAAWRYWLVAQNQAELLKFMDSFSMIYELRGWHQAAFTLFTEAAALSPPVEDDIARLVRGKALGYAGLHAGILGKPEQGLALCRQALTLIRPRNRPEDLAHVLLSIASNDIYLGNFEQVVETAQALGRIGQQTGMRWAEGISLSLLAMVWSGQQQWAAAEQAGEQALQIFTQDIDDYFGLTWAALVRGLVALAQGAYAEARVFYEHSLKAAQALNYRRPTQQAYDNLGDVAFYQGELDRAEQYFRLSLEISEETGQIREMLGTVYDLAKVWAAQEKKVEAVELLAVVLHHPLSKLPLFLRTGETALAEAAERLRARLAADLAPQTYQIAWARGRATPLETVVVDLLR